MHVWVRLWSIFEYNGEDSLIAYGEGLYMVKTFIQETSYINSPELSGETTTKVNGSYIQSIFIQKLNGVGSITKVTLKQSNVSMYNVTMVWQTMGLGLPHLPGWIHLERIRQLQ